MNGVVVIGEGEGTMRFVEAFHEMEEVRLQGVLPEQVVLSV
jgi:hypothetical protein